MTMANGSVTLINDVRLDVEIAANNLQRLQGLMHRTSLEDHRGMLFVYPRTDRWGVWMKNTLLALDVIFISEQGRIVDILENLPPCTQDPCPIFHPQSPARYMLEVNAGLANAYSLQLNQELLLDYRQPDAANSKQPR